MNTLKCTECKVLAKHCTCVCLGCGFTGGFKEYLCGRCLEYAYNHQRTHTQINDFRGLLKIIRTFPPKAGYWGQSPVCLLEEQEMPEWLLDAYINKQYGEIIANKQDNGRVSRTLCPRGPNSRIPTKLERSRLNWISKRAHKEIVVKESYKSEKSKVENVDVISETVENAVSGVIMAEPTLDFNTTELEIQKMKLSESCLTVDVQENLNTSEVIQNENTTKIDVFGEITAVSSPEPDLVSVSTVSTSLPDSDYDYDSVSDHNSSGGEDENHSKQNRFKYDCRVSTVEDNVQVDEGIVIKADNDLYDPIGGVVLDPLNVENLMFFCDDVVFPENSMSTQRDIENDKHGTKSKYEQ